MTLAAPILWKIPQTHVSLERLEALKNQLDQRLTEIVGRFKDVRFATSLAAEDMAVTDGIARVATSIQLFTLDTGRLHAETLAMADRVQSHYQLKIKHVSPSAETVTQLVNDYGLNGFYDGEEQKKACCNIRKVQPLALALSEAQAWLTGQRRSQAVTRQELHFEEWDDARAIAKFNPIFDWSDEDLWAYTQWQAIPIHPLHHQGYPSIGCEPCTRAVKEGEDIRAGRWWWLLQNSKECGLHIK